MALRPHLPSAASRQYYCSRASEWGFADPVAVRYAWADNPICNPFNQNGLPVCPFRAHTWPGITAEHK
jgi:hypothetical protein